MPVRSYFSTICDSNSVFQTQINTAECQLPKHLKMHDSNENVNILILQFVFLLAPNKVWFTVNLFLNINFKRDLF